MYTRVLSFAPNNENEITNFNTPQHAIFGFQLVALKYRGTAAPHLLNFYWKSFG